MGILNKLIGGGAASAIKEGANLIDKVFTNDEERAIQKRKLIQSYINDRTSAREMYKTDNILQKIFAIVFLAGYLFMTGMVIYILFSFMRESSIQMPDWGIALINMLFGAMSAKVNTITDFLFGSSQGSQVKDIFKAKDTKNA